ncbi:acyl carrier protein [Photorhabdus akhurstii]|nr:acyl carrier protein [Photorhabdus luminescens]
MDNIDMVNEELASILVNVAELDSDFKITSNKVLKSDLGIDSLKLIDVILSVERTFGKEISEDALARIQTVGELWEEIKNNLQLSG